MAQGKTIMQPGYSGKPLFSKLGIKTGHRALVLYPPANYMDLLQGLPSDVIFIKDRKSQKDIIHVFAKSKEILFRELPALKNEIVSNGMIWVSWPKKTSGVSTDLTEDIIRDHAILNGLVDVKVCAIDETWSGLKLVIPVSKRKT